MTTTPKPRLAHMAAIMILALALVASACGIERDQTPQILALDDLPQDLRPGQVPTPQPTLPPGSETAIDQIFMIGPDGKLIGVERARSDDPGELLDTLLERTRTSEAAEGISTALSRDARVQSLDVNELFRLATVDLAPGSLDTGNKEQKEAFAQIVFTLTSLDTIEEVVFVQTNPENLAAGAVPLPAQTDAGTSLLTGQRVGRDDFALLDPSITPVPSFDGIPTSVPTVTPVPNDQPEPSPGVDLFDIPIWKLDEQNQLIRVARQVERTQEALLFSLFDGTLTDERADQIRTAIPPDAFFNDIDTQVFEIIDVDAVGNEISLFKNTAVVDLAQGSLPPSDAGQERLLATAQIVFTLTELIEIDQVALAINGVNIPMDVPAGLTVPFDPEVGIGLSREDFVGLVPSVPGPTPTPIPTPDG